MATKFSLNDLTPQKVVDFISHLDRRMLVQYAILVFALLLFVFGGFLPILFQNGTAIQKIKKFEFMIQAANARISKMPEMKKEQELLDSRVKTVRANFFKIEEINELIRILSETAQKTGVEITASRPTNPSVKMSPPFDQTLTAISYDLSLRGGYHELAAFFNGLERYPKNFILESFFIKGDDSAKGRHEATMVLTAFVAKTPDDNQPNSPKGKK